VPIIKVYFYKSVRCNYFSNISNMLTTERC